MIARLAAVAAALVLAAGDAHAGPRTLEVPDQPAQLVVDEAWQLEPAPGDDRLADADAPAMILRHGDAATLVVTVAAAPNADAWRSRKRRAYLDEVIAGFAAQPGVTVDKHRDRRVKGVPTLELWLTRKLDDHRELVVVRLLLFRTRTVMAAAAGARSDKARLEAAARGLEPKHEADPDR